MSRRAVRQKDSTPGWLIPAMGIALVIVIASGSAAGKFGDHDTKGIPPRFPRRPKGPWQ